MAKPRAVGAKSQLEEMLALELTAKGIEFQREYRFYPQRRWRYDFFLESEDKYKDWPEPPFGVNLLPPEEPPKKRILVDVQGGLYAGKASRGKHARPEGYANDAEKMFRAQMLGYTVIYATAEMIRSGRTVEMIKEALAT